MRCSRRHLTLIVLVCDLCRHLHVHIGNNGVSSRFAFAACAPVQFVLCRQLFLWTRTAHIIWRFARCLLDVGVCLFCDEWFTAACLLALAAIGSARWLRCQLVSRSRQLASRSAPVSTHSFIVRSFSLCLLARETAECCSFGLAEENAVSLLTWSKNSVNKFGHFDNGGELTRACSLTMTMKASATSCSKLALMLSRFRRVSVPAACSSHCIACRS